MPSPGYQQPWYWSSLHGYSIAYQGRSVVGFNVKAQSNIYSANISQIHFLLGNFTYFVHFVVEARASLPLPSYAPAYMVKVFCIWSAGPWFTCVNVILLSIISVNAGLYHLRCLTHCGLVSTDAIWLHRPESILAPVIAWANAD